MIEDTHSHPASRRWTFALLGIFLLALILRGHYVITAIVPEPLRGDAFQYFTYAWNLSTHGVFSSAVPGSSSIVADSYRDPGYPALLALGMKFSHTWNAWYAWVLLVQAVLGACAAAMAAHLGRYWLPPAWAFAAGLLMAAWPHSIAINGFLVSETLSGFLCALAALLAAKTCRSDSRGWAIGAGLLFGLAGLTNAVLIPFGVLLAVFFAWRRSVSRRTWVALALSAMLLPTCWAVRGSQLAATQSGQSSLARAEINFVIGSWPGFQQAWRDAIAGNPMQKFAAQRLLDKVSDETRLLQQKPLQGASVIYQRLAEHPWRSFAWYVGGKPALLWGWDIIIGQGDIYVYRTVNAPFQTQRSWRAWVAICRALNPWLAVFAVAGALLISVGAGQSPTARSCSTEVMVPIGLCVYATLVYSVLQSEPRYAIAFRPFEITIALTGCQLLISKARQGRGVRIAL